MPALKHLSPLALLLVLLLAGCDSAEDNGGDPAYFGTWYNQDRDQYLVISADAITAYATGTSDCYVTFTFEIVEHDGGTLQLADGDVIEVSVDGDEMTLTEDDGDVLQLTRSDLDPEEDLDLC